VAWRSVSRPVTDEMSVPQLGKQVSTAGISKTTCFSLQNVPNSEDISMRQREETDRHASPSEARQAARKLYQKPAVRFERVFETSALVCGKIDHTQRTCGTRKTS
jgi:hypothetical protein